MFIKTIHYSMLRAVLATTLIAGMGSIPPAQAETVSGGWAQGGGGPNLDYGVALAVDESGNAYATGFVTNGPGNEDTFIQKWDPSGNHVWANFIAGPSNDVGDAIALDGDGNVYVTGYYSATVDFDEKHPGGEQTSTGLADLFLIKYDNKGNFLWVRSLGGISSDRGSGITVDSSGNIYLTGSYSETVDFDPGAGISTLTSTGSTDVFVSQFDRNGNFIWAKSIGGPSQDESFDIAVDTTGNIIFSGYFSETADFDPGVGIHDLTSVGEPDAFFSKFDNQGNYVWAIRAGGSAWDSGIEVVLDASGNIYTTGYFEGPIVMGASSLMGAGYHDVFINKLDSNGNFLWARSMGGPSFDTGYGITLDEFDNVYTIGEFGDTVDFDPGVGTSNLTSAGLDDIFISKLDNQGNFLWAKQVGGPGNDGGEGIALGPNGSLYLNGYFSETVDFDPGAATNTLTSAGSFDVFLTRLVIAPQVHYVKWDAAGTNDGSSWANAYKDLQSALAAASSGEEIWVAAGTYKPTASTDRAVSFTLKNGVEIYGGFAGTETTLTQRDVNTNVTTLSGDIGVAGNDADNSYHVVTTTFTGNSTLLDGFTITKGNANGTLYIGESSLGGGLYIYEGNLRVINMTFSENHATYGGGLSIYHGNPIITNTVFSNNTADQGGGGVVNFEDSSPTFTDVAFSGNSTVLYGGGMANYSSQPTLSKVIFYDNHATYPIGGRGGGIYNQTSNTIIENTTFSGNTAERGGSGIANVESAPILTNVTFTNNWDVILNRVGSHPVIQNSIVWGNVHPTTGAISISDDDTDSSSIISDSVVQNGYAGGTNIITTDPLLGALGNYGGFTETIPLQTGSSAIDAGNDSNCPSTDQRGVTRPQGIRCDLGAYEFESSGRVHYVKWDANGSNNGTTWANAYKDLQSALAATSSGDEIWVAAGTYKPTSGTDRTISFTLKNGVEIYGGFVGTETSVTQRNLAINATVLSGDIGTVDDASDNSYHVVIANDVDNTVVLDGFTITAGNANGSDKNSIGGGMYTFAGSPTISNITFIDNAATTGGGMSNENQSNSSLTHVIFNSNTAATSGGGMDNLLSNPILADVTFINNWAQNGGGMTNVYSKPALANVTFHRNGLTYIYGKGGGMENFYSDPILTDVIFSENSPAFWGGGMYNDGSNPNLTNVTFYKNAATDSGGGMSTRGSSSAILTNVTFTNNSAAVGGGMKNDYYSHPILTNVTFSANSASNYGGGMSSENYSNPTLTNVTLSDNAATISGGGIYSGGNSNTTVRNTILWANMAPVGQQIFSDASVYTVNDSVVQNGFPDGTNIITTDPLLGPLGNYGGFTETIPLQTGSPAIDAGNDANCPSTDQRGVTRPQAMRCDIGAYEFESNAKVLYVKSNANGLNDGTSWANAYKDLQSALAAASSGDQIWVAAGTYKPTTGTDRTFSFKLQSGVEIYGGFAGTETALTQRDVNTNVTILSGDIGVVDDNSDNSYHVVVGSNTNHSAILDGFTVTRGNASNTLPLDETDIFRGGGLYNYLGSPTISNIIFSDNYAVLGGGMNNDGVYAMPPTPNGEGSNPALMNVTFVNNSAIEGGGLRNEDNSSPTLTSVIFDGNKAQRSGGGMENYAYNNTVLQNVTFRNNRVASEINDGGGGGMINFFSVPVLTNVTFDNNSAPWGGGVFNVGSNLILTNVTFIKNVSTKSGGGIGNYESSPMLTNVTFSNNSALTSGGGIYNESHSNSTVRNTILWGNTAPAGNQIYNDNTSTSLVSYSVIEGGYLGPGNLDTDPLLGPLQDNGGFTQTMKLKGGSPAIDAGNDSNCPSTDQRGVARPHGRHCDIGAYENNDNVSVRVAGALVDSYHTVKNQNQSASYPGINNGPLKIQTTDGTQLVASERVAYSPDGGTTWTSYSELMGMPVNQLSTSYTFPWYNDADLNTQLRFGNVGNAPTTVTVRIAGQIKGTYSLLPNQSTRVSYPGLNAGPVKVTSSGNVPIIASERVAYFDGTAWTSFAELMGLPSSKLTTSYIFPWYNNMELNSQLRFGNVGTANTTVTVTVGGVSRGTYNLAPNQSTRVSYPGLNAGPIKVTSSGGVPIIASLRVAYTPDNITWTEFSETMGMPTSSLSTSYSFAVYNNVDLNTQLRFGNVGTTSTTVTVTIGGVLKGTYLLRPDASQRVNYAVNDGPVVIQSSGNVKIIASERVAYFDPGLKEWTSFSEMMGLPKEQLTTSYLFPWYNNVDLDTQIRFGVP